MPDGFEVFVFAGSGDDEVGGPVAQRARVVPKRAGEAKACADAAWPSQNESCDGGVGDPADFSEPEHSDFDHERGVGQLADHSGPDFGISDDEVGAVGGVRQFQDAGHGLDAGRVHDRAENGPDVARVYRFDGGR